MKRKVSLILIILVCSLAGLAQMSRKPSPTREPAGAMPAVPDSAKRSQAEIKTQADFDALARIYHQGTPYALPHIMFAIDRRDKNKIYYINSQRYRFHKDFLTANYLVLKGNNFFEDTYLTDTRRFIVGTIAWQTPIKKFTFEFWDGDLIPADQIKLTSDIINQTFFAPVAFKPNSVRQDELSANLGLTRISSDEISKNQDYLALNTAKGIGRIHIIDKLDDTVEIGYNEILVLKEFPLNLPPVAGLIISQPSTPLSHINLLAKGWNIPNAYIKNAQELFKQYNGRWIEFETKPDSFDIKPADKEVLDEFDAEQKKLDRVFKSPPSDLKVTKLASLSQIRKKDSIAYGAKAANLGELTHDRIIGATVPNGFSIPFYYYAQFMKDTGLEKEIENLMDDNQFVHNPRVRRQKLAEFREKIQNANFDEKLKAEIINKWRTELGGRGVFVRSSSNSEDLPNFSGAGLYTSVANVKDADKIIEAVKTVWASLWNFDAYEARERNFIEHTCVYMSAFIQVGVNMDNGGGPITRDPCDPDNKNAGYISATFGH
ncbi:MAG: PEP/pyruvate-binding domain-containing protein, partial [Pyrinomonadaceae bacterium]